MMSRARPHAPPARRSITTSSETKCTSSRSTSGAGTAPSWPVSRLPAVAPAFASDRGGRSSRSVAPNARAKTSSARPGIAREGTMDLATPYRIAQTCLGGKMPPSPRPSGSGLPFGLCRRDRESALAHQGRDSRIPAAEIAVVLGGIDRVARREDVVEQALRDDLVVRPAGLHEGFPGVGRERVGPEVAVIAGGIAVAREDVGKLRRT